MLKQSLQQRLLQKLSPQQIQLMKLLQLPTIALEQRIKEEIEGNPALEEGQEESGDEESMQEYREEEGENVSEAEKEFDFSQYMDDDTPSYKLYSRNKGHDEEEKEIPLSTGKSFHEHLTNQLGLRSLSEDEWVMATHLIGNLDDSGYLRRELSAIIDDLAFSQNILTGQEELEKVLKMVQDLDPPGVGARDLQECLLLQLNRKAENREIELAKKLLSSQFKEFTKKHYSKITKKLGISDEELKCAIEEILRLNPKPGNSISSSSRTEHIIPDFVINNKDGDLELTLNSRNAPELKVSRKYSEMMEEYNSSKDKPKKAEKEALMFVKQKLDAAKWFIDAIKQRQQTLVTTMQAIMEHQYDYFLEGDETKLRPMILKDIAERIGLDISTVSRVANSKYVQTPYGTFLLKSFFSESLSTDSGEEVSTREVKKILQDLIENESKKQPLTDEKLAKYLKEKGYNIARRTVAKYREQLHIPVARLRKEL